VQKEERKIGSSDGKKLSNDLVIVGKIGDKEITHQKKVQKLNELIKMRMERKKRVKELMAKRGGTFEGKM
jgi:hypothetical protein